MTFLNEYVELGFKYPCETEPIRDLPTARLVVSSVNRSTLTRVSSRSEISASVLTSQGREITVDNSRLLSSHPLRNRVEQSFCLAMARAEGPSGHQLKIRHPSQLAVGVRDSDEWGLIESR